MAKNCFLCDKQMGFFDSSYVAANDTVCEDCYYKYKKVFNLAGDDEFEKELEEFKKMFANSENLDSAVQHLCKVHDAKYEETAEERQKLKEQKEKEEQERAEAKAAYEREQERLLQKKNEKIEKLREQGLDGYYEYKVLNLNDDSSGGADCYRIQYWLDELGLDGWHLRCAYTNELGKNTTPGLLSTTNSTIDQNILIFERFVKILREAE
jgi:hypothetical protein